MSESTLHEVVDRVADFLEAVAPKYLKMPLTEEEKQQTCVCFEAIAGFPKVLGAMDGTHIRTRCPNKKVRASFVDRHDTPTYTLQAGRFHIIADAACPLREYIMTPYRDHGHMTGEKKRFNYRLWSSQE
ncbi:hypothetical protein HPB52_025361 [Rhipicephalus sanguineus]|uniref:DDE Tnp4 domain-containing protein n=1 Tax=Rhipicephalus sanguineus TaxID=34632 RepID=A0A9D4YRL1_RHISA|nr:hypothetical protein HPB52_025361 [Rhipicephalus sanguineus]